LFCFLASVEYILQALLLDIQWEIMCDNKKEQQTIVVTFNLSLPHNSRAWDNGKVNN
jgi:hypothetical protein